MRESKIREAEGEAEAILRVQTAIAKGIELINQANPTKETISVRSLEALEKVADGKATKLIIPSEIQNLTTLAASLKEVMNDKQN